jgi:hypothetical protein
MRWHLLIAWIIIMLCVVISVVAAVHIAWNVSQIREIIQLQAERLE